MADFLDVIYHESFFISHANTESEKNYLGLQKQPEILEAATKKFFLFITEIMKSGGGFKNSYQAFSIGIFYTVNSFNVIFYNKYNFF